MSSKILSENPTELELKVAQAFIDLESQADLKAELRPLQFKSIKEIDVAGGKKALAVFVPPPSTSISLIDLNCNGLNSAFKSA